MFFILGRMKQNGCNRWLQRSSVSNPAQHVFRCRGGRNGTTMRATAALLLLPLPRATIACPNRRTPSPDSGTCFKVRRAVDVALEQSPAAALALLPTLLLLGRTGRRRLRRGANAEPGAGVQGAATSPSLPATGAAPSTRPLALLVPRR